MAKIKWLNFQKTIVGLICLALVFPVDRSANGAVCAEALERLSAEAVAAIAREHGARTPAEMVRLAAVERAQAYAAGLIEKHLHDVAELQAIKRAANACETGECWHRVTISFTKKVRMIVKTIRESFRAQRAERANLMAQAEALADQWVESHKDDIVSRLQVETVSTEETGEIKVLITEELKKQIRGRFSFRDFAAQVGQQFTGAFRALAFHKLRTNQEARDNYKRNLITVVSFQVGAQITRLLWGFGVGGKTLGEAAWRFLRETWIPIGTTGAISLESEQAAVNLGQKELPSMRDFPEGLTAIPRILAGEEGYWRDTQRAVMGFLTLLPLKWAITVALNYPSELLFGDRGLREVMVDSLVSNAIFGSYLALRFSLLDSRLFLGPVPAIRKSAEADARERLAALKASEGLPSTWEVGDFVAASKNKRVEGLPHDFDRILETEDAKELLRAYARGKRMVLVEYAYKYGFCAMDSLLLFATFTDWIPSLLGDWLRSLGF